MARIGKDYLACNRARRMRSCDNPHSLRVGRIEGLILDALRDQLMQPAMVEAFTSAFSARWQECQAEQMASQTQIQREREKNQRKIDELVDAISEGMRSPALARKLADLEARQAQLDQQCQFAPPSEICFPPDLPDLYRTRLTELRSALADPNNRHALELARSLITRITMRPGAEPGQMELELEGALPALLSLGQCNPLNAQTPPDPMMGTAGDTILASSSKVVAGARFELTTFRL